jgi:HSP20 family protein
MGQVQGKRNKEDNLQNPREEQPEGPVEGVLRGLDEVIPGLGELVKGLEKSEVFKKRLEAANAEVQRRMEKAPPSSWVGGSTRAPLPAGRALNVNRSALREESPASTSAQDVNTDIFDEGSSLVIVTELPGIDEKDIKVDVKGDRLELYARSRGRRYFKNIGLPCRVKEKPVLTYKNGILRISLKKETK